MCALCTKGWALSSGQLPILIYYLPNLLFQQSYHKESKSPLKITPPPLTCKKKQKNKNISIWSFSNGQRLLVPGSWSMQGCSLLGSSQPCALWDYRGNTSLSTMPWVSPICRRTYCTNNIAMSLILHHTNDTYVSVLLLGTTNHFYIGCGCLKQPHDGSRECEVLKL